jgi:hypothetical protein
MAGFGAVRSISWRNYGENIELRHTAGAVLAKIGLTAPFVWRLSVRMKPEGGSVLFLFLQLLNT